MNPDCCARARTEPIARNFRPARCVGLAAPKMSRQPPNIAGRSLASLLAESRRATHALHRFLPACKRCDFCCASLLALELLSELDADGARLGRDEIGPLAARARRALGETIELGTPVERIVHEELERVAVSLHAE